MQLEQLSKLTDGHPWSTLWLPKSLGQPLKTKPGNLLSQFPLGNKSTLQFYAISLPLRRAEKAVMGHIFQTQSLLTSFHSFGEYTAILLYL